ncbi:ferritin-like domain-containing protein [Kibdelosporangium philippinense]|uniref:Ferritin-like domain-containing protein n=1 Tax=Kibdelosporangium philippinense TaxID=211113 RepID=A0ABS8ZII6_9PSEU|nr:ferritin-like domain-containing protein [Kibdelosporangium philippinense]MCE7007620.1 ferritin-like domain-containing protein [Kibdelosporangium philippinense]
MTQPSAKAIPADSIDAVQQALGAEHAAIWTYGLVSAFLPNSFNNALNEGATTHRARRDTIERSLNASDVAPKTAEVAYVPPQPVTDQASSLAVLAIAESDAAVAWRSVLEHTDDADLRKTALEALTSSAVRGTRWRKAGGQSPAATEMPGQPS